MGRIAPNYYVQDSVIPRTRLAEVLGRIEELGRRVRPAGGERLPRRRRQPAPARLLRRPAARARPSAPRSWPAMIVKACVDAGGSITGEHGVGVDKKRYMPQMFDDADLGDFQRLRCAFDPDGLRQPGQGHAHAAAVRRGARPLPAPPARAGRAWRSASDGHRGRAAARLLLGGGAGASRAAPSRPPLRVRGAGTKLRLGAADAASPTWSCPPPGSTGSSSTTRATSPRCSRPASRWPRRRSASREAGQMLALDPPLARAARPWAASWPRGDSGPLRPRYGGARDLVVGMTRRARPTARWPRRAAR